ncbi:MAG: hypothetical protein HC922_04095 [Leptolyngbyaceae cyanobacterium SM2_3_12]|nr:hypothetical protein [Leptolyngbyaceae cyanobacterium SM2_3_12]
MNYITSTGLPTITAAAITGEYGQLGMVAEFPGPIAFYLANGWAKLSWAWRDFARCRYLYSPSTVRPRLHAVFLG